MGSGRGEVGAALGSIPVASTDTRKAWPNFSSVAEPKIMFASASTFSRTWLATASTSKSVRSVPPVTLMRTPRAPSRLMSSSSGLAMARSAASSARLSPSEVPVPIMALPMTVIRLRTSAKSRLTTPGLTMRSETPRTPSSSTSSAMRKASAKVVASLATRKRFWLGITMSVSTCSCRALIPCSASRIRVMPSN